MLRISLSGPWYHKKLSAFYALLLALSLALILTVFPLFDSVIDGIAATGAAKYGGKHDSIVYNLSEEQLSALRKNLLARKVGVLETYGSWTLAGTGHAGSITIGSFDETAWQLGCIPIFGRPPARTRGWRWALEAECARSAPGARRRPVTVQIPSRSNREGRPVTSQPSAASSPIATDNWWDLRRRGNPLVAGYNDLPKGIVALQQTNMPVRHLHALCLSDTGAEQIAQFAEENGLDSSGSGRSLRPAAVRAAETVKELSPVLFSHHPVRHHPLSMQRTVTLPRRVSGCLSDHDRPRRAASSPSSASLRCSRVSSCCWARYLGLPLGAGIAWFADRRLAGHAAIDLFSVQSLCTLRDRPPVPCRPGCRLLLPSLPGRGRILPVSPQAKAQQTHAYLRLPLGVTRHTFRRHRPAQSAAHSAARGLPVLAHLLQRGIYPKLPRHQCVSGSARGTP